MTRRRFWNGQFTPIVGIKEVVCRKTCPVRYRAPQFVKLHPRLDYKIATYQLHWISIVWFIISLGNNNHKESALDNLDIRVPTKSKRNLQNCSHSLHLTIWHIFLDYNIKPTNTFRNSSSAGPHSKATMFNKLARCFATLRARERQKWLMAHKKPQMICDS